MLELIALATEVLQLLEEFARVTGVQAVQLGEPVLQTPAEFGGVFHFCLVPLARQGEGLLVVVQVCLGVVDFRLPLPDLLEAIFQRVLLNPNLLGQFGVLPAYTLLGLFPVRVPGVQLLLEAREALGLAVQLGGTLLDVFLALKRFPAAVGQLVGDLLNLLRQSGLAELELLALSIQKLPHPASLPVQGLGEFIGPILTGAARGGRVFHGCRL